MIVLIEPILSFVLLHENKFDIQIEGLRAEFKAGYQVLGGRFDTRMTKLENKYDECIANMDRKLELLMAAIRA